MALSGHTCGSRPRANGPGMPTGGRSDGMTVSFLVRGRVAVVPSSGEGHGIHRSVCRCPRISDVPPDPRERCLGILTSGTTSLPPAFWDLKDRPGNGYRFDISLQTGSCQYSSPEGSTRCIPATLPEWINCECEGWIFAHGHPDFRMKQAFGFPHLHQNTIPEYGTGSENTGNPCPRDNHTASQVFHPW